MAPPTALCTHAIIALRPRGLAASQPHGLATSQPRGLASSQPRSLASSRPRVLASSQPRSSRPRSLAASRPRSLEASKPRSLAALRPRSPAALRPRSLAASSPPSRAADSQPCGLAATLAYRQPRSLAHSLGSIKHRSGASVMAKSFIGSATREVRRGNSQYCKCQETLNVIKTPGSRSLSVTQPNRMCTLRRSLIAAPVDGNVPSSEEEEEEEKLIREREFPRARYSFIWLCSFAAPRLCGLARPGTALAPCGPQRPRGFRRRYGFGALGVF